MHSRSGQRGTYSQDLGLPKVVPYSPSENTGSSGGQAKYTCRLIAGLSHKVSPSRSFSSHMRPGPDVRSASFGLSVGAQICVYLGLSEGPLTMFHFWRHFWQSCTDFLFFFKLQMLKILPAFELPRGAPHLQPPCAVAMTTSPSL